MKTYLVTGAAGFIGANYIKYILKMHDDVRVVVLDLEALDIFVGKTAAGPFVGRLTHRISFFAISSCKDSAKPPQRQTNPLFYTHVWLFTV